MPNASLIFETALLFLIAFLIGATVGALARRLLSPRAKSASEAAVAETKPAEGPQLVVAPTIAPIPGTAPRRSAAERLAAAAGRDLDDDGDLRRPSRIAGDATGGKVVPSPSAILAAPPSVPGDASASASSDVIILPPPEPTSPAVVPEAPVEPVRATEVPPIDEVAQVVDRPVAVETPDIVVEPGYGMDPDLGMPVPLAALVEEEPVAAPPPKAEDAPVDVPPPLVSEPTEDLDESAAMRAIEGGDWRPRRAAPTRPVPHPEQAGVPEIEVAMANTRSAVASATAAAAAAIAESEEAARERRAAELPLDFETEHEAVQRGRVLRAAVRDEAPRLRSTGRIAGTA
jgi:hypothetical protein